MMMLILIGIEWLLTEGVDVTAKGINNWECEERMMSNENEGGDCFIFIILYLYIRCTYCLLRLLSHNEDNNNQLFLVFSVLLCNTYAMHIYARMSITIHKTPATPSHTKTFFYKVNGTILKVKCFIEI